MKLASQRSALKAAIARNHTIDSGQSLGKSLNPRHVLAANVNVEQKKSATPSLRIPSFRTAKNRSC